LDEAKPQEGFMSFSSARNPTQFFSVVGAPYVPESHAESRRHLDVRDMRTQVQQREMGVAGLWLVLYAAIIGASLFGTGGAVKVLEVAQVAAH
jgi:hypothetical protein